MGKYLWPPLISIAVYATVTPFAGADSFRCGRKLIRTGDTAAEVLRVCGQPRSRDRGQAEVRSGGVTKSVSVERWHYKGSSRRLWRVVNLHRGRVVAIEVGSR